LCEFEGGGGLDEEDVGVGDGAVELEGAVLRLMTGMMVVSVLGS
jgi:hypothetical protein